MTAQPVRWLPFLFAVGFLAGSFFLRSGFAQEAAEKPSAPTPKAVQPRIPLLAKPTGTLPKKRSEPQPERVPDLPALATRLLEYLKVLSCAGVNCRIWVTNFVLPDGNTSQYGMDLADELSKEMARQHSDFQIVDHQLLLDFLTKDRILARSVNAGVIRAFASTSNAGFVVLGTTTKRDGFVRVSADLFELTGKEWNGYSVATDLAAPRESDAMLPSEPFGPLPSVRLVDDGEVLYQGGRDGVSLPNCTYMPNPAYSEAARRFAVSGFIQVEAIVTAGGRLKNARVINGLPGGLNEQTIASLQTWRCNPALKDGHPVATLIPFEVNFRVY